MMMMMMMTTMVTSFMMLMMAMMIGLSTRILFPPADLGMAYMEKLMSHLHTAISPFFKAEPDLKTLPIVAMPLPIGEG